VSTSSASGTMDIFSTALASADINLDSFQYIEDGIGMSVAHHMRNYNGICICLLDQQSFSFTIDRVIQMSIN
jgi:hypothetical protein